MIQGRTCAQTELARNCKIAGSSSSGAELARSCKIAGSSSKSKPHRRRQAHGQSQQPTFDSSTNPSDVTRTAHLGSEAWKYCDAGGSSLIPVITPDTFLTLTICVYVIPG